MIAILHRMKTSLVVSPLVLLGMVGAATAQGQGAGGQQQEQNGQTTPNNGGFSMDNNMMMMMMIPMMKRVRTSCICLYKRSQQSPSFGLFKLGFGFRLASPRTWFETSEFGLGIVNSCFLYSKFSEKVEMDSLNAYAISER